MNEAGLKLKLALDGQAQVSGGLDVTNAKVKDLGMSVKQLNAATRGVGAQFTDIFTGLASGQAPLTVLIQQGGQLKDMFGGVAPAAKALGGYIVGLVNPYTLAAGAAAGLGYAAYQGSKENDAYTKSIVMTGNASGVTAGMLGDMARKMADVRGTQAAAAESLAEMVGTGRVAREDLQKFSQVAVDMERTVGQSVADTAKSFADLAKDPVKASQKLNETLGYLTTATYAQIKAAKEMGDDQRAAALATNALADALSTRTAQMEGSLGTLERAWLNVKKAVAGTWDAMLSVGRASSLAQQLATVSSEIAQRQGQDKNRPSTMPWQESLDSLQKRQAYLQEQIRLEQRGAEAASARAAIERAGVAAVDLVTTANEKARTKQEQMNKALADYRKGIVDIRAADPNSALLDPKKIAAAEDGIRRQFKETNSLDSAYKSLVQSISEKTAEVENELAVGKKLTEGEKLEIQYKAELKDKLKGLTVAQREVIEAGIERLKLDEKTLDAAKKALDIAEKRQDAARKEAASIAAFMEAQTEAANKSLKTVADRVQALQDEEAAVAISQQQNVSLAAAVEMVAIARLKEEQARKFVPGSEGWEAIQREIDKRQELLGLMNTKDLREREQSGWLAFYNSLDRAAQDTFTNVLEGGQGIWTKIKNTAKSVFFDWLYQMTAKKWLFNLTVSASGGALPVSAGAGGLNDINSLLSGAGTVGSTVASWLGLGGATTAGIAANIGIGTAAGLTVAEATAAATAAGAAAGSGLMTTLAPLLSAAPYLAAIAGVYMLAKNLDKSGTPHSGGGALYSAAGGLRTQGQPNGWSGGGAYLTDFGGFKVTEDATKMAAGIAQSVVGLLDSAAFTFGQQAGYAAATAFADDTSSDGAWGALAIKLGDKMVAEWGQWANGPGGTTFSDGAAGSAEYLAKITGDVRTVLNGIDMPDWAKKILNDLPGDATLQTLGEAVAAINKTQTAWSQLGKTLTGFAAMGDDAKVKLTAASGGIDALVTNASAYYENFYSEGERTAATLGSIQTAFAAVNVPMPATREAFRTLVESLQATADTNPYASAALATVLSLSGAFASVVPAAAAAENATTTLVDTVEEVATLGQELDALRNPVRTIKEVAQGIFSLEKEGANLQVELWRTYGDSNSILAANKLQRDIETAGMTAQEIALYDLNAARRAEIDTIVAQRQAVADGVASWEAYFEQFGSPEEKQSRAKARVQAVLPADVDTLQEYKDYVWRLTEVYGVGSAEVKKATDVARDFAAAFPAVSETIAAASTALTTDLSAYYAALFTPAEQVGYATGVMTQKFADLGFSMPTTVQGFKDLVDSLDTTTEAGRVAYNTVVGLAGAWKDLQPAVAAAVTATTDLSAYHAAYFTETERAGLATSSLTATLASVGLALPTTREGFRALVQAQDLSTESGIRTYNTLIGVAGAFADLVPAATVGAAAVETLDDLLTRLRNPVRTLDQIAGNIVSLEEELFQAQNAGNTQALRDHILAGLTPEEQILKKAIWAIEDYNQSVADNAAAAQAAAEEMQRAADAAAAAAQKIASEHDGLWRQWLTLNKDTAALRALDLAALDPSNRALQEQIWALEDQQAAADKATTAAEQMRSAWASLTDSITDEVRRIRGLIDESSGASYASLAAQFATATAQTRAGDQDAAKRLPGLSQSMLTAFESSATSLVDLQRVRALTANSLETTAGLASGVAPNGYGTAVLAPADAGPNAPAAQASAAVAAQTSELQGLRAEVAALRAALEAVAINTGKSTRLAQKWDDVGIPVTNTADGAPLSVV